MYSHSSFRFIDLFSGIGGFRKSLEAVGGRCVFSCEKNPQARKTYEANFNTDHPFADDIKTVKAHDIPAHDVLTAGFPCQSFSIAGIRKGIKTGAPGNLFFDIIRILAYHRPSCFILENVRHLLYVNGGRVFDLMRLFLEADLGYHFQFRLLNASSFVPQSRVRLFMVGFREKSDFDLNGLVFPEESGLSIGDILDDDEATLEKAILSDREWHHYQAHRARHRARGNGFGYRLADLGGLAPTLTASYRSDGCAMFLPREGGNPRRFTPRECARLMGFEGARTRDFIIPVSDNQAYRQFGNAVVPPLVEHLARAMRPHFGICGESAGKGKGGNEPVLVEKDSAFGPQDGASV